MTNNPSVNRYLKDKAMDHIDHALGRPVDPLRESYRNYFAIDKSAALAEQFSNSPNWKKHGKSDGDMLYFHVTEDGRKALSDHLKKIKDPHKAYSVTVKPSRLLDSGTMIVVAKSNGAAKYKAYVQISDSYSELTFRDFLKVSSARLAVLGSASA